MNNIKKIVRYKNLKVFSKTRNQLILAFKKFLKSGQYLPGKNVKKFENKIASFCGRKFCIGVSSGTTAIYLALKAHNIGNGDEVICPAISWVATANAIAMTGAKPVFVDVEINQTISPKSIIKAITKRTKGIVVVHFTGVLANVNAINKIAKKNNILTIEDAAQAFGAEKKGKFAGGFCDISALSFNPMKVFQGYGEAGAVLTNSIKISKKLKEIRDLGLQEKNREICKDLSLNFKIDELQSCLILENFKNYKREMKIRKKIIKRYCKKLKHHVIYAEHNLKNSSAYDYQILATNRDRLMNFLKKKNVETRIKHPILMSNQPIYRKNKRTSLNIAKMICKHNLSLPLHRHLTASEQDYVINKIINFYKKIN